MNKRRRLDWSGADDAFLRREYPVRDTHELADAMGRSPSSVRARAKALRIRKQWGRFKWSSAALALLRATYPHMKTAKIAAQLGCSVSVVFSKANKLGLRKTTEYLASPDACRLRRDSSVGAPYRFKPGHVPANKGRKGWCAPGCEKSWFRKGHSGTNTQPVGALRITTDGQLDIKVAPGPRQWRAMHRWIWEQTTGKPVPKGFVLRFKDGDRHNPFFENLELVSMRDNMLRNSIHNLPRDIVEVVQLRGVLTRQINQRSKQHERSPA